MTSNITKKSRSKYSCTVCDFNSVSKRDFDRHILTRKHKILTNTDKCGTHFCQCGKEYKHRQSLYNHKKKCKFEENKIIENNEENNKENNKENKIITNNEEINYKELLHTVIKQNSELQKTITDLIPKIGNTTNNTNTNNINQKFNINVFLNEDCKNALTMEQFIDKLEVTMGNLFLTKSKGIDEGISNIFIENMNKLSLHERPMHCTDTKRDTIYIKSDGDNGDEAQWAKDTDKEKIKRAIKKIEYKQHKNLGVWMKEHPGWEDDPKLQEEYLDLMRSCTKDVKDQKIIKNVCNTVKIDQ